MYGLVDYMCMIIFTTLVAILQSFSISLGVGSSTLAIINFFVAISDGRIDETERRMMGVVYVVLRVAMVLILLTTITLLAYEASMVGSLLQMSVFSYVMALPLAILFINALLMTLHIMPSTFGPSIQAASWYTLGALMALKALDITGFSFIVFILSYITWIVLATAIVNGIMAWLKAHRHGLIKK
jgi:hypothetical protein